MWTECVYEETKLKQQFSPYSPKMNRTTVAIMRDPLPPGQHSSPSELPTSSTVLSVTDLADLGKQININRITRNTQIPAFKLANSTKAPLGCWAISSHASL